MTDDALSRAKKALPSPAGRAVVPVDRLSRNELIARARDAAARPVLTATAVKAAPAAVKTIPIEDKGTALITRLREGAAKPVPTRPVVKAPEPPKAEPPVPVEAPASVPTTQVVPVQVAPGQTVPVEIPQNAAGAQQPINVSVTVVNEQRGPYWGPYWYPYWHGCGRYNCPHLHGQPCNRLLCW